MTKHVYYCVLKNYKGLLKKRFVDFTHLFILPRTDQDYLYLSLLGERTEVSDVFACVYITRVPNEILSNIIDGEKEYFGNRFELVDEVRAKVKTIEKGTYLINLKKLTDVFQSKEMIIVYQQKESTTKKRIYNLVSKLNLHTNEIDPLSLKMVASRNIELINTLRFKKQ